MRRIHVVGCSPRSGTTLMMTLLTSGFAVDDHCEHEVSIFAAPPREVPLYCSKNPGDVRWIGPLVEADPDLWVVYMLRDPRDVVVSIHREDPARYWSHLRFWKEWHGAARRMTSPRFLQVKYEELVRDAAGTQRLLQGRMPFLEKTRDFVDCHATAKPSARALAALGGLRPLSEESIGAWRRHKSRVAGQLELHGPITQDLVDLGYEPDDRWLAELDGVTPNNHRTHWPDHEPADVAEKKRRWAEASARAYLAGLAARGGVERAIAESQRVP